MNFVEIFGPATFIEIVIKFIDKLSNSRSSEVIDSEYICIWMDVMSAL